MVQLGMCRDQPLGHGAVVETVGRVGDDQPDRAAGLREMTEFGISMSGQAHHRDGTGAQQTEQRHGEPARIRQLQEDPISGRDPDRGEPGGGPVHKFVQFGICVAADGVHGANMVGPCRRGIS